MGKPERHHEFSLGLFSIKGDSSFISHPTKFKQCHFGLDDKTGSMHACCCTVYFYQEKDLNSFNGHSVFKPKQKP